MDFNYYKFDRIFQAIASIAFLIVASGLGIAAVALLSGLAAHAWRAL